MFEIYKFKKSLTFRAAITSLLARQLDVKFNPLQELRAHSLHLLLPLLLLLLLLLPLLLLLTLLL
jgi:CHASE1-domain containing sensor protein